MSQQARVLEAMEMMQEQVQGLCRAFARGLAEMLGGKCLAVYICGAVTFPETTHTGDVDFHVILSAPPTDEERLALLRLHARLADEFPPLGAELDGYYILESDARGTTPPRHLLFPQLVDSSWALHRAHILAGRVIVLHGPEPRTIYVAPTWSELDVALVGELDYVARHLEKYPDYCVLNLCRLLYSWETRDVVTSKVAAAAWARSRLPRWVRLIDLAVRSYGKEGTADEHREMLSEVPNLLASVAERVAALRGVGS